MKKIFILCLLILGNVFCVNAQYTKTATEGYVDRSISNLNSSIILNTDSNYVKKVNGISTGILSFENLQSTNGTISIYSKGIEEEIYNSVLNSRSEYSIGVYSESSYNNAIVGSSSYNVGVYGYSLLDRGVVGYANNTKGVAGYAKYIGGYFESLNTGLVGMATESGPGVYGYGLFDGGIVGQGAFTYGVKGYAPRVAGYFEANSTGLIAKSNISGPGIYTPNSIITDDSYYGDGSKLTGIDYSQISNAPSIEVPSFIEKDNNIIDANKYIYNITALWTLYNDDINDPTSAQFPGFTYPIEGAYALTNIIPNTIFKRMLISSKYYYLLWYTYTTEFGFLDISNAWISSNGFSYAQGETYIPMFPQEGNTFTNIWYFKYITTTNIIDKLATTNELKNAVLSLNNNISNLNVSLENYVPYNGSTADLDLNNNKLIVSSIENGDEEANINLSNRELYTADSIQSLDWNERILFNNSEVWSLNEGLFGINKIASVKTVSNIVENAIENIPAVIIPLYDNTKIISIDSNQFVKINSATNLVMYNITSSVETDYTRVTATGWLTISTPVGEEVPAPWQNPQNSYTFTLNPDGNGDSLYYETGWQLTLNVDTQCKLYYEAEFMQWVNDFNGIPSTLIAQDFGQGVGNGSLNVDYATIIVYSTNEFKTFTSFSDMSNYFNTVINIHKQDTNAHPQYTTPNIVSNIVDSKGFITNGQSNVSLDEPFYLNGYSTTWNPEFHTFQTLLDNNVLWQWGQENLVYVKNKSGHVLEEGRAVCVAGSLGDNVLVNYADSQDSLCKWTTIGLVTSSGGITNDTNGYICTFGNVNDINTSIWQVSNTLWLASNGTLTNVEPAIGSVLTKIKIGTVLRSHTNQGRIFLDIQIIPNNSDIGSIDAVTATNIANSVQNFGSVIYCYTNANSYDPSYSIMTPDLFNGQQSFTFSNITNNQYIGNGYLSSDLFTSSLRSGTYKTHFHILWNDRSSPLAVFSIKTELYIWDDIGIVTQEIEVATSHALDYNTTQSINGEIYLNSEIFRDTPFRIILKIKAIVNGNYNVGGTLYFGNGTQTSLSFPAPSGFYARREDLNNHITNTGIHVTTADKLRWDSNTGDVSEFTLLSSNNTFSGKNTFTSNVVIQAATEGAGNAPLVIKQLLPYGSPYTQTLLTLLSNTGSTLGNFTADGRMNAGIFNAFQYFQSIRGSASAPSIRLNTGVTGIYYPTDTSVGISVLSTGRLVVTAENISTIVPISTPSIKFNSISGASLFSDNSGLYFVNSGGKTQDVTQSDTIYSLAVTSSTVVAIYPTNRIYAISVSEPNSISNDLSGISLAESQVANWELWVNYQTTNSLSTVWDSRINWQSCLPAPTVTGLYKFAMSMTISGIEGKQIFPSVYCDVGFLIGSRNNNLAASPLVYQSWSTASSTNDYVIIATSMNPTRYIFGRIFYDFVGDLGPTNPASFYGGWGGLQSLPNQATLTTFVVDKAIYAASGPDPRKYIDFIMEPKATAESGSSFLYIYARKPYLQGSFSITGARFRPANELEIQAYLGGWRP